VHVRFEGKKNHTQSVTTGTDRRRCAPLGDSECVVSQVRGGGGGWCGLQRCRNHPSGSSAAIVHSSRTLTSSRTRRGGSTCGSKLPNTLPCVALGACSVGHTHSPFREQVCACARGVGQPNPCAARHLSGHRCVARESQSPELTRMWPPPHPRTLAVRERASGSKHVRALVQFAVGKKLEKTCALLPCNAHSLTSPTHGICLERLSPRASTLTHTSSIDATSVS
jgi:hypothetical protein